MKLWSSEQIRNQQLTAQNRTESQFLCFCEAVRSHRVHFFTSSLLHFFTSSLLHVRSPQIIREKRRTSRNKLELRNSKLRLARGKTPPLPQGKSLWSRFVVAFCRLITGQIGSLLQQIPLLALNKCNNAPALVKSTNLLDFCTCFHRSSRRTVSFN